MNRRKFLTLSALFAAPAIIKAENLMKIWVPDSTIIEPQYGWIDINTYYKEVCVMGPISFGKIHNTRIYEPTTLIQKGENL